jgi:hypothetical protein
VFTAYVLVHRKAHIWWIDLSGQISLQNKYGGLSDAVTYLNRDLNFCRSAMPNSGGESMCSDAHFKLIGVTVSNPILKCALPCFCKGSGQKSDH